MTPERWQRVKIIVGEALERDPSERGSFVEISCGTDKELSREVHSLLAWSGDKMEGVAEDLDSTFQGEEPVSRAGERLGAYEIAGEIGRGGMGAVYLARRADKAFEKQVAIKVLKRGTETDEVLRRFRSERQILAQLEHPNIARLVDAGTTADGLPYFVMEHVEGVPITDYCEAHQLTVRQRVELFLKVCAAVHFAHRTLIVHRDLKPGNILITKEGEAKLLDFGIAKLLDSTAEFAQTVVDQQRLTPSYASPEQVRGELVTTATDVYSLGALLYELLVGASPHRFSAPHPSSTELFRVIVDQEPLRASVAVSLNRKSDIENRKFLAGDLDNILQTALRKEAARRYSGVTDFADDLRRYLEHRPVRARPATVRYRASRFFARNKVAVTAGLVLFVALIAGGTAYIMQARRAAFHAQREAAHFRNLRKLANLFIFKYYDGIAELPGSTELRKQLVQDALEYLSNLATDGVDDPVLLREIATAYKRIADVQGGAATNTSGATVSGSNLGDTAGALENYNKARTIRERLAKLQPGDYEIRAELAEVESNLGDINLILGHPAEAAGYFRSSIVAWRQLLSDRPNDKRLLSELRSNYAALASVLAITPSNLGDIPGGLEAMHNALVLGQALVAQEPGNAQLRQALGQGYGDTGRILFNDGNAAAALDYYRKALAIGEALTRENPQTPLYQRELAVQHRNVGSALLETLEKAEALAHFREAVALFEKLIAADPQDARLRRSAAYGYRDLGEALSATGDRSAAQENLEKALRMFEELAAKDPKNSVVIFQQAITHLKLSRFFLETGDVPGARSSAERALAIAQEIVAKDSKDVNAERTVAEIHAQLGHCAAKSASTREQWMQAQASFQRSAELWRQLRDRGNLNGSDSKKLRETENALAACEPGVTAR
ncbi:MAG TPA: protein kinase [Chthoniobacterales bacterium]|jgi:non-specific serine/threonine protein kinase/serine/threonine-protein kinase|nr:protein kinase [Chthoniobacterales bacterium]